MKRRIRTQAGVLALAAGLLAGCGSTGNTEASPPTQTVAEAANATDTTSEPTAAVSPEASEAPAVEAAPTIESPPADANGELGTALEPLLLAGDYSQYSDEKLEWWNVADDISADEGRLALVERFGGYGIDRTLPRNTLYLTFDLDYEIGYTDQVLDVLKANDVQVTFFITGHYLAAQAPLVQRMRDEGHIVANHMVDHVSMPELSDQAVIMEVMGLEAGLKAMGIENKIFRPPSGEYSERTMAIVNDLGYKSYFWTWTYKDYDENDQPGESYAYDKVMSGLRDGSIILLHPYQDNANALDRIIKDAKAQGYRFASLTEIQ